jgi:fructose-1-phosphate kinase PfkB-like protein
VRIARLLARLDIEVCLCGPFGGATGAVFTTLIERDGIGLRRSPSGRRERQLRPATRT